MLTATFTELRNNAKSYFDAVERGETVEIYRKGKLVGILSPVRRSSTSRWKTARPLKINGSSLSKAILAERAESR